MNIHGQSILLLLSPFPSKGCQPVLCTYACISAVSASSRYVACFLVKLFLIPVSLTFACCSLFSASSLPSPQLSSSAIVATTTTTAVPTSSMHTTRSPLLPVLAVSHTVTSPPNSRRRAFERDTDTTTERAPTAAHNDKEHWIIFLYILNASQDGPPQDRNRADTCQSALRARARVSAIPASWLS